MKTKKCEWLGVSVTVKQLMLQGACSNLAGKSGTAHLEMGWFWRFANDNP